ncbi:Ku protein [Thermaerobacter marianensis DSM 12885]|uniref:Non-homologous end joining protein Ku n=1 Tax=Thermaerobacter marianensis (strain ATCC 700841 / DSM 12885 / JCM 10246 / 7p75a) TaxID=644966 RepID=E6SKN4_THEM7|nr:Ku protein [Thermaerobacter marianensis]ADU51242.1 Ku protein [Thermaerobacter marianensis DSM 12885]
MRSLWRGVVSFGLVNIPVRMYLAVDEKSVHFRQLHRLCGTPVRYRRWCPRCDVEVRPEDLARGYEYAPDRFVLITDEDLAGLPLPTARAIEILDFVRGEEIDPIYFQRSYYLEPAEGGEKAYRLLRRAMDLRRCVAVAKVALRNKETLACLRTVRHQALALVAMAYPDEVRPLEALPAFAALGPPEPAATGPNGATPAAGPGAETGARRDGAAAGAQAPGFGTGTRAGTPSGPYGDGPAGPVTGNGYGGFGGDARGLLPGATADRELELALHLIDRLTTRFDPTRYRDRYREALLAVVERKIEGREAVVTPPEPAPVVDLMEALRASLERVESRRDQVGTPAR